MIHGQSGVNPGPTTDSTPQESVLDRKHRQRLESKRLYNARFRARIRQASDALAPVDADEPISTSADLLET
jgi:hypothetical protein